MKHYYLASSDPGKDSQLLQFASQFPTFGPILGYTALQISAAVNDALWLHYIFLCTTWYKDAKENMFATKDIFRDGPADAVIVMPDPATIPVAPVITVTPGIIPRFIALGGEIKHRRGYTVAMGNSMALEGANNIINLLTLQPVLKIVLVAGKPYITFKMGDASAADIFVERTPGAGFTFLVRVISPEYTDNFVLPAGLTSALYSYKAIFLMLNAQVGQFSASEPITVSKLPGWLPEQPLPEIQQIIISETVNFGQVFLPTLEEGNIPPLTTHINLSTIDLFANFFIWFLLATDYSITPPPEATNFKVGKTFDGTLAGLGMTTEKNKCVILNNGTADGKFIAVLTVPQ